MDDISDNCDHGDGCGQAETAERRLKAAALDTPYKLRAGVFSALPVDLSWSAVCGGLWSLINVAQDVLRLASGGSL